MLRSFSSNTEARILELENERYTGGTEDDCITTLAGDESGVSGKDVGECIALAAHVGDGEAVFQDPEAIPDDPDPRNTKQSEAKETAPPTDAQMAMKI